MEVGPERPPTLAHARLLLCGEGAIILSFGPDPCHGVEVEIVLNLSGQGLA